MPEIIDAKELAVFLNVHYLTIIKLAKANKIPCFMVGKQFRFDKQEVLHSFKSNLNVYSSGKS